jgi:hypothetical protein
VDFSVKVMPFVMFGIFVLSGISMLTVALASGKGPPVPFAFLWLFAALFMGYQIFSTTHKILVHEQTAEVEFVSLLSTRRVRVMEVVSIKPVRGQIGFLTVTLRSGSLRLLNQFDGFHELLAWLKAHNPGIELRGC